MMLKNIPSLEPTPCLKKNYRFGNLYSMYAYLKYQLAISRFRVSSHILDIELGDIKNLILL